MAVRTLSKSKLIAFRQCPKRLWLEVHRKELREDSTASQAAFQVGHTVGELARRLYDPEGRGHLISVEEMGFPRALARTKVLLAQERPIFEAGFSAAGVLAFADVLVKRSKGGKSAWHVVEVKSSGSPKDYHRDDLAVQSLAMHASGLRPGGLAIAHVDGQWVYPGNEDYKGLLKEVDLTEEARSRATEVREWVAAARQVAAGKEEPEIPVGAHCNAPFACGFIAYCESKEPKAEYPVEWLPRVQTKALKEHLSDPQVRDMRQVPDVLLNDKQRRVKKHTLEGEPYFDVRAAAAALLSNPLPAYFLDFETVSFTVPIWPGTRPFQQIPFQFSVHVMQKNGKLTHDEFLDVTGVDPSRRFAEALVRACGERGTIYVYNAAFEKSRMAELAERFSDLEQPLQALIGRVADLRPIAEAHYYHPAQQGSWSIKALAPTIAPELGYDNLQGISEGGAAMEAYKEAISPGTSLARKEEIQDELRCYCGRDTEALVRFWDRCTMS